MITIKYKEIDKYLYNNFVLTKKDFIKNECQKFRDFRIF